MFYKSSIFFFLLHFSAFLRLEADSSTRHGYSSVTQSEQDVCANLEPTESANCVYLDTSV